MTDLPLRDKIEALRRKSYSRLDPYLSGYHKALDAVLALLPEPRAGTVERHEDSERLDWLEAQGAVYGPWLTYECVHEFEWKGKNPTAPLASCYATVVKLEKDEVQRRELGKNLTLREAIDAARAPTPPEGGTR